MTLRSRLCIPALIWALTVVGCGGGSSATLVPVGGKVVVDGQPMDGVTLTFIPDSSLKNVRGGTATTDAAGAFTVTDLEQNKPGIPAGKYLIAYSRRRLPDGSAGPAPGAPADPGAIKVETFPNFLTNPDPKNPALLIDIPKEGNTKLDLKISKKKTGIPMGPG